MDIHELLNKVKNNEIEINEAEHILKKWPYEDLGFAKLDHHRKLRQGFGEVVYCEGKATEYLVKIFTRLAQEDKEVLGTRAGGEQYEAVRAVLPDVEYDSLSKTLIIADKNKKLEGCVAVCSAGTADLPVAEEAAKTAEFLGSRVIRIYDVGVAGIHRLFHNLDTINDANCVIAVAGMEGALPSVLAGLVEHPVIAVPTSVGYGASFNGLSALLTMLNSCANGISVVNIDNGYGAGYVATQINKLAVNSNG